MPNSNQEPAESEQSEQPKAGIVPLKKVNSMDGKAVKIFQPEQTLGYAIPRNLHKTENESDRDARIYEYVKAANPEVPKVGVYALDPALHQSGKTRIIPFDLSESLGITSYMATSPNLMASYLRIKEKESLKTNACATSQAFYVIRGSGKSKFSSVWGVNEIQWAEGDLYVIPAHEEEVVHEATTDSAIYWVTDEPLLKYLGVGPRCVQFKPTYFANKKMLQAVEELKHEPGQEHKNRLGILLGNKNTDKSGTLTLSHTLWCLLNVLGPQQAQPPHRHNSVAIDFAISSPPKGVYTMMGPELGEDGWVKDPIRVEWTTGGCFVTPPGWWHSHHNETDMEAWVLPIQDAGLYTYQQTLDIQFSKAKRLDYKK